MANHKCRDCGIDTNDIGEMYMLYPEVWTAVSGESNLIEYMPTVELPGSMLCIGCAEFNLGRELTWRDFMMCPLNYDIGYERSERLQDRMKIKLLGYRDANGYIIRHFNDRRITEFQEKNQPVCSTCSHPEHYHLDSGCSMCRSNGTAFCSEFVS